MVRGPAKSGFLRHVLTVSAGQVVTSAIPLFTAPLLGRLYTPKDYGLLAAYMGYAMVFGSIATWQYSQAIVIEKTEVAARTLVQLCFLVALVTSILSLPFAVWMSVQFGAGRGLWFLLLPASVLAAGVAACLAALANRWELYARSAKVQWLPAMVTAILSVSLALMGLRETGLLLAYLVGQVVMIGVSCWVVSARFNNPIKAFSWLRVRALAFKHRDFAIFTTPTGFLSASTISAPVFVLTAIGLTTGVGFFNRANQLLALPFNLIGSAIAQVFQRRAAQDMNTTGSCRPLYLKTLGLLLVLGTPPILLLAYAGPALFGWFLGANWVEAGDVARLLAPMLLLRLLCSPLSTVFFVVGAQRLDFGLTMAGCVISWAGVVGASCMIGTLKSVVVAYSAGYSLTYAVFVMVGWRLAGGGGGSLKMNRG